MKIEFSANGSKRRNLICASHLTWQKKVLNFSGTQHQFTIFWIKSGSAKLLWCEQKQIINTNRLFCFPPFTRVLLVPDDEIDAYVITFSEDFLFSTGGHNSYPFSPYYYAMGKSINPFIESEIGHQDELENIMKIAVRDYENGFSSGLEMCKGVMQVLAVYFTRKADLQLLTKPEISQENLFKSFMHLLEKHYVTKKTVIHYALLLAVTPNFLSEKVKTITGFPASFYIHQHIIREAKRVATGPRVSLKEVAFQVGFSDVAHFSKFFRNKTGMNFTDYQKLLAL